MSFPFAKYSKTYYIFSGLLVLASIFGLVRFGLKFGIDFTGGSLLEMNFESRPENSVIQEKLSKLNLGDIVIQPIGDKAVILRTKAIDDNMHKEIITNLSEISKVEEVRFETIGPSIGKELRQKALLLIGVSLLLTLIYITVAFLKISRPLSSFQYGVISIVTLCFDILIPLGVFSVLGKFYNVQFTIPIVAALLTVLGYTMNDKIVVFDRVRENLMKNRGENFYDLVNRSLNEILIRSITTGSCTIFVLLSIFFFGGDTLKYFALALILGILIGTYSSLFVASPLLVSWVGWKNRRLTKTLKVG